MEHSLNRSLSRVFELSGVDHSMPGLSFSEGGKKLPLIHTKPTEHPEHAGAALPIGFVIFSETHITNTGDSFNGAKVTSMVRELQENLSPDSLDTSERVMKRLLEEIRTSAYGREWTHLCVRTGRMWLQESSKEAFQVVWEQANGLRNTAIWFKK